MSVDAHKDAIRRVLKAYGEGDVQPVLALLHRDIVWTSQAPPAMFRFGGAHNGHAEARLGISTIAADYTIHAYEVGELVGEGDVVWLTATLDVTEHKSKSRFPITLVSRWQFRDGQVLSLTEYYDTATIAMMSGMIADRRKQAPKV